MGLDFEHKDDHLPSILTKDDFIIQLLIGEMKSLKSGMSDIKKELDEHCKKFSDFRISLSPISNIDIQSLNKLLAIDPKEITKAINSTNVINAVNKIILPILVTIILGLTFLGLREYVGHHDQNINIPSPPLSKTHLIIDTKEEELWDYMKRV